MKQPNKHNRTDLSRRVTETPAQSQGLVCGCAPGVEPTGRAWDGLRPGDICSVAL